jgi:hypothetical protein
MSLGVGAKCAVLEAHLSMHVLKDGGAGRATDCVGLLDTSSIEATPVASMLLHLTLDSLAFQTFGGCNGIV